MQNFGKVAVLMGGFSSERNVSLDSGAAIVAALKGRGVDAHAFDPKETPLADLKTQGFQTASNRHRGRLKNKNENRRRVRSVFRQRFFRVVAAVAFLNDGLPADNVFAVEREGGVAVQLPAVLQVFQGAKSVFLHDVYLEAFFSVKDFQRAVVGFQVLAFLLQRVVVEPYGHGVAQDGHAVVELDDAEFVHEQQSLFEQDFTAVFGDLCGKCQIVADVLFQFSETGFHHASLLRMPPVLLMSKGRRLMHMWRRSGGVFAKLCPCALFVFEAQQQHIVAFVDDVKAAAAAVSAAALS